MPKQIDPQDPELRQLPAQGLSGNAIRDKLNYKVHMLLMLAAVWTHRYDDSRSTSGMCIKIAQPMYATCMVV